MTRRSPLSRSAILGVVLIACGLGSGSELSSPFRLGIEDLHAQDLKGAVTVAGTPLDPVQIQRALDECKRHAVELPLATCLDRYWVPRWVLDAEASSLKLSESAAAHLHGDIMQTRLTEILAEELPVASAKDIDGYINDHRRDFEKPERIRIFRILVATREDAQSVIEKLSPSTTVADFRKLARDLSLDRATNERAGDLGFVWPDGSTDIPQVSAETSLYEAAAKLSDGQFSSEPVREETRFAVIWRRGSLPAIKRGSESSQIAALRLKEKRTEEALQKLLDKLGSGVKNRDSLLLGKLRRKEATLFKEP